MRIEAEVTRGRRAAWSVGATSVSVALLAFLATQKHVSSLSVVAIFGVVAGLSFVALVRGAPPPRSVKRRVTVDARGLEADGELLIPRQSLKGASVKEHSDGSCAVTIQARGFTPSQVVRVESPRIAQALADCVGEVMRAGDVTMFNALPPWARHLRWLTVVLTTSPWIIFNVLRHVPGFMMLVVLALYGLIALPLVVPQKIAIGEDGVLLRWAGRRRFIPFAAIHEARMTPLGVELSLIDGREVEIRVTQRADGETANRRALLERIEEGVEAHRRRLPAEDEALLERNNRPIDEWIREMDRLGAGDVLGYRAIAIARERLWAVLENPSASPSAREGAALALRARLDDDEAERLRTIGKKSASPHLRVALEAVASSAPSDPTAIDGQRLRIVLEEADLEDAREPIDERRRAN